MQLFKPFNGSLHVLETESSLHELYDAPVCADQNGKRQVLRQCSRLERVRLTGRRSWSIQLKCYMGAQWWRWPWTSGANQWYHSWMDSKSTPTTTELTNIRFFLFLYFFSPTIDFQVNPPLYGDTNTRLFTYWTVSHANSLIFSCQYRTLKEQSWLWSIYPPQQADGFQKQGCYDLQCPGFVQVSRDVPLGGTISPLSQIDGTQYYIRLLIYRVSGHLYISESN